ncbi:hypothetical protein BS329_30585 [Amycolatopsis coloradensis]|uniref:Alpha/beta hydrolase fold-3 domain-containing protein n=2 Tax=Amycolatopsis coloradensis TaxID=76021 RepID=A0A1R0KKI5_9PSEU|nr:hypothetical protein BS329_30585 [Amycolatopsis coloradensis]
MAELSPHAAAFLQEEAVSRPTVGDAEICRAALRRNSAIISGEPPTVATIRDYVIDGDTPVPVRIYNEPSKGSSPVIVYFHGGGFVIGDLDTVDTLCRHLALAASCVVVSVDYRLAPEYPYPAAISDSDSVVRWILGGGLASCDTTRLALGGDSAGANLATVTALRMRDRGEAAAVNFLAYPFVDLRVDSRPSRVRYGQGYGLDGEMIDWYKSCYLPSEDLSKSPFVSPVCANLKGLPHTLIMTAECDPLRDQGEDYGRLLANAGVTVTLVCYAGELHGFLRAISVTPAASAAISQIASTVKRSWNLGAHIEYGLHE